MKFFVEGTNLRLGNRAFHLSDAPFSVGFPQGKVTALLGKNGSGKTTLLRACLGEQFLLDGKLVLKSLPAEMAFVSQEQPYPPDLLLEDFLELSYLPRMGLFGRLPEEAPAEVKAGLLELDLSFLSQKRMRHLSPGERQRVFLLRALLQKPKTLLLDEPTSHLDPGGVERFWDLFFQRRKEHAFEAIVSTHDLSWVEKNGPWVLAMRGGTKVFEGEAKEFFLRKLDRELY